MKPILEHCREIDERLVKTARGVKVLSSISWPRALSEIFLKSWRNGAPKLPKPPPTGPGLEGRIEALEALARPIGDHPIARYLSRTAESYLHTARLLQHTGTETFTEISSEIYGRPSDPVAPGGLTNLEVALSLLEVSGELAKSCVTEEADYCLTPRYVQSEMQRVFDAFFTDHPIQVEIDPNLASKAAAGAEAVRIREGTCFSRNDFDQLIQHEGFVHVATARNGRLQTNLRSLGLSAPRTTATQEGLATFAEFITNSIDLNRLRRIALRIVGIDAALKGADFVDVFKIFLEHGQSEKESYFSAARVFRGGDPAGGIAFTKDNVYLQGLMKTQTFMLSALEARKVNLVRHLFAGRMTWGDARELEPFFKSGWISAPRYQPDWVLNRQRLAAWLSFSNLTHRLPMQLANLGAFIPTDHLPGTTQRWSR